MTMTCVFECVPLHYIHPVEARLMGTHSIGILRNGHLVVPVRTLICFIDLCVYVLVMMPVYVL